jgi:predicted AlkP superfamily pyrophosphatase or phosphodiesterase
MRNAAALDAVEAARFGERFVRPLYGSYCFSGLPATICGLLTGEDDPSLRAAGLPADTLPVRRCDTVILVLVDAFGWRFFERYWERYPFLRRFVSEGVASKLTTQFPSTTAAHVTTIHTGLTPGESGVWEWQYYEPQVDAIIAPLLFSFAGDHERNTLFHRGGVSPGALFRWETLYQKLARRGVRSTIFQHRSYTPSPFSDRAFAGARVVPYRTPSEALVNLAAAATAERGYYFLYLDAIDTIGHQYGPGARVFEAEVDTLMTMLERLLHESLAGHLHNALLLVTADHGQIEVSPATTVYLNQELPALEALLKRSRRGDLLVPAGSPRDMFLYARDERLEETRVLVSDLLAGHAEVHLVDDLIAAGLFGPGEPSEAFRSRIGNLAILPYEYETVWWYEQARFEQRFLGSHGGLTRAEMETILLALPYA